MGVIARQSIKTSIVSYAGVAIGMVNILYVYPLMLQEAEIGIIRFLMDTTSLLLPFVLLGANQISIKFYPEFRDRQASHLIVFLVLVACAGYALFFTFYAAFHDFSQEYFAKKYGEYSRYVDALVVLVFAAVMSELINSFCVNLMRIAIPAVFKNLYPKIIVPLFVIAYYLEWIPFAGVIGGLIGMYSLMLLSYVLYFLAINTHPLRFSFANFDRPRLRRIASYGFFGVLGSVGSILAVRIDTFMVATLAADNLKSLGIYAIAFTVANVVAIPAIAVWSVVSPAISTAWEQQDRPKLLAIYQRAGLNAGILGMYVLLGIWTSIDYIFELMPNGDRYDSGKYVILVLGIAKLLDVIASVNHQVIGFSRHYRVNLYVILVLAFLNIISNLLLIPSFDILGAALATLFSMVLFNLIKLLFIYFKMGMSPFTPKYLYMIGLGIATHLLVQFIPDIGGPFVNIIVRSVAVTLLYLVPILLLGVSDDLNDMLLAILKRFRNLG